MVGQSGVRRIRRHDLGQVRQWYIAPEDPPSDPSMNLGDGRLNCRGDKTRRLSGADPQMVRPPILRP